jgi:class 3 adenylate cyclase
VYVGFFVSIEKASPIHTPTLILHRIGDEATSIEDARYLADQILGARLVELPGTDHFPYYDYDLADRMGDEAEQFLTGERAAIAADRVLATVLFTDIVDSTQRAAQLGDRQWHDLLDRHNQVVRRQIGRFRGQEIKTLGDGFLATFDGRRAQCAAPRLSQRQSSRSGSRCVLGFTPAKSS